MKRVCVRCVARSRVLLGRHYLGDVAVGAALGLAQAWALLAASGAGAVCGAGSAQLGTDDSLRY